MYKTDSSMYNKCLEEDLRIVRDIEFLKTAVVYKYNAQGTDWMNRSVAANLKDIPDVIRSLKYNSTPGSFVPATPWGEGTYEGSFPTSHYWQAPNGPGPYLELNISVTPDFKFDTSKIRFRDGKLMLGPDMFNLRDISGEYDVIGRTVMRTGYSQEINLEYWDISKGYVDGNKNYEYVKPVTPVQNVSYPGLFRAFTVRLHDRPESEYNSLGCYIVSLSIPRYVTNLGACCFYGAYNLQSVYIEASLSRLPDYCFYYCNNLTTVNIPTSVVSIGDDCFAHSGIAARDVLNLSSSDLTTIGDRAFEYCKMNKIVFGENVSSIGIDAFAMCTNLIEIEMQCKHPPVLATDDSGNAAAFYNVATNGTLRIPADADIKEWIQWCSTSPGAFSHLYERNWKIVQGNEDPWSIDFYSNRSIMYSTTDNQRIYNQEDCEYWNATDTYYPDKGFGIIEYSEDLTTLESGMIMGRSTITSLTLPKTITSFGNGAFYNLSNLREFTVPSNVTSIGESCFDGCSSIKEVKFETPCHVSTIHGNTFANMPSLEYITIPNSVSRIEGAPFVGGHGLKYIKFTSGTAPTLVSGLGPEYTVLYDTARAGTIPPVYPNVYVPNSSYRTGYGWSYWDEQGVIQNG